MIADVIQLTEECPECGGVGRTLAVERVGMDISGGVVIQCPVCHGSKYAVRALVKELSFRRRIRAGGWRKAPRVGR